MFGGSPLHTQVFFLYVIMFRKHFYFDVYTYEIVILCANCYHHAFQTIIIIHFFYENM